MRAADKPDKPDHEGTAVNEALKSLLQDARSELHQSNEALKSVLQGVRADLHQSNKALSSRLQGMHSELYQSNQNATMKSVSKGVWNQACLYGLKAAQDKRDYGSLRSGSRGTYESGHDPTFSSGFLASCKALGSCAPPGKPVDLNQFIDSAEQQGVDVRNLACSHRSK